MPTTLEIWSKVDLLRMERLSSTCGRVISEHLVFTEVNFVGSHKGGHPRVARSQAAIG